MHAFLLSIGVMATAIGMFTIGFGIPINEFSFGNTLIIAGTVSVTGGLILIGIAAAVRELRRIADLVAGRTPMRRPEPVDPLAPGVGLRNGPGLARGTIPLKPNIESSSREPRPGEPRLMAVPADNGTAEEPPTGRPRPNILPLMRAIADAAVMEESDSVPLSPQAPARAAVPGAARSERPAEVKPAQQPVTKLTGGATAALRSVALESPRVSDRWIDKPQQTDEKPQHPHLFDTLWPAGTKVDAVAVGVEAVSEPKPKSEPKTKTEPRPRSEAKPKSAPKPKNEAANPNERIEPVVPVGDKRDEARVATGTSSEPQVLSVLKSGVIDGMGYTLYTDGTIDAQLSEGTMRFSSIDALRDHLEKIP
jgi:hypothetical protein